MSIQLAASFNRKPSLHSQSIVFGEIHFSFSWQESSPHQGSAWHQGFFCHCLVLSLTIAHSFHCHFLKGRFVCQRDENWQKWQLLSCDNLFYFDNLSTDDNCQSINIVRDQVCCHCLIAVINLFQKNILSYHMTSFVLVIVTFHCFVMPNPALHWPLAQKTPLP